MAQMDARKEGVWELLGEVGRLMFMKRGALVVVAMALIVSACASVDPSAPTTSRVPTPTVPPTTSGTPGSPTSQSDEEFCGTEFPLFVAGVEGNDPTDIYGTPGPGPGSQPAAPDQMVSHWLGEFGNLEFRWPPTEPLPDTTGWTTQVAGKPATIVGVGSTRVTLYVLLDDNGDRCSQFAAEVYGPRTEPLGDSIFLFVDALRDGAGAQAYLAERESEITLASAGADYPEGRCQSPLVLDSEMTPTDAVALVADFLADRGDRRRAQGCLTESGLAAYQNADQTIWPFLCLFECDDGAQFATTKVPPRESGQGDGSQFVTAVVTFGDGESVRSVREEYEVVPVTLASGVTVAAIASVYPDLETQVDEGTAMAFVSDLLRRLAEGHYEIAAPLLIDQGVSAEIEERLPGVWERSITELLGEFCSRAMCTAASRIVGTSPAGPYTRDVIVTFDGANGVVTKRIQSGAFEGYMTAGGLPPDGEAGAQAVPLVESVFLGRPHSGIVVLGERSLELWGTEASAEPTVFYNATRVADVVAAGEWIVANSWWSETFWASVEPVTDDGFSRINSRRNPWGESANLVGGGTAAGVPYAFIVQAGVLSATGLDSRIDQTLFEADSDSGVVVNVSMAGDTLAVTRQSGENFSYELYSVTQAPDSSLDFTLRRFLAPPNARGPAILATDGLLAAYVVEGTDRLSSAVAIVDTAGNQVGSYQGPEGWNVTRLTFDGRWVLATLESPSVTRLSRSDRILVIDTLENEQWVVDTFARFAFRY